MGSKGRCTWSIVLATAGLFFSFGLAWSADPSVSKADPTLSKGYSSERRPDKGVVLYLHGCDGLFTRGFVEAWFVHLERAGFKVIAPDSFADARPSMSCAPPFPNKDEIYNIRLKQTSHIIGILRKLYPGKPLYLWGHSEGGGVANLTSENVDGIITTGYQCGFRNTGNTKINKDVPLLVFVGNEAFDVNIRGARQMTTHPSQKALCEHVFGGNDMWQFVEVPDAGHNIPIYNPTVLAAVNSFLQVKTSYAGPDGAPETRHFSGIKFSDANAMSKTFKNKFVGAKTEKAFAIGPNDTWGFATGMVSEVDAIQEALYFCNGALRKKRSQSAQRCVVYAVDERIVFKK
jgi:hypothetical protein